MLSSWGNRSQLKSPARIGRQELYLIPFHELIPERSEGYKSDIFVRACVPAWVRWQSADLAHFNQLFLQVCASLGCQTLHRLGACWVLHKRGQLVPMLWQVRAWGTRGLDLNLSRTLLDTVAMASATWSRWLLRKRRGSVGMLRLVSEKSIDAILSGFVWTALLLVTVGVVK